MARARRRSTAGQRNAWPTIPRSYRRWRQCRCRMSTWRLPNSTMPGTRCTWRAWRSAATSTGARSGPANWSRFSRRLRPSTCRCSCLRCAPPTANAWSARQHLRWPWVFPARSGWRPRRRSAATCCCGIPRCALPSAMAAARWRCCCHGCNTPGIPCPRCARTCRWHRPDSAGARTCWLAALQARPFIACCCRR